MLEASFKTVLVLCRHFHHRAWRRHWHLDIRTGRGNSHLSSWRLNNRLAGLCETDTSCGWLLYLLHVEGMGGLVNDMALVPGRMDHLPLLRTVVSRTERQSDKGVQRPLLHNGHSPRLFPPILSALQRISRNNYRNHVQTLHDADDPVPPKPPFCTGRLVTRVSDGRLGQTRI